MAGSLRTKGPRTQTEQKALFGWENLLPDRDSMNDCKQKRVGRMGEKRCTENEHRSVDNDALNGLARCFASRP